MVRVAGLAAGVRWVLGLFARLIARGALAEDPHAETGER